MKSYILKSILFVVVLLAYCTTIFLINSFFIRKNVPHIKGSTVIMGDSHTMTSIDPSLLHSADNISQSAEPYFVTYFKLKEIVKHNKIDTLLLGFSYQNISAFNDYKFSDAPWCDELLGRTYSLISINQYEGLQLNKISYYRSLLKNMLLFPKQYHSLFMGSFDKRDNELNLKKSNLNTVIKKHYYKNGNELHQSTSSLQYLDSIKEFSESRNIKLILVNTPLHASYRALIPQNIVSGFEQVKSTLINEGIMVVDYSQTPMEDNCYADYDHLNYKGAQLLTAQLKHHLKHRGSIKSE